MNFFNQIMLWRVKMEPKRIPIIKDFVKDKI